MSYVYLASPYSDPSQAVRNARYLTAAFYVANAFKHGTTVFSPIVHNHALAAEISMPKDADWWWPHNLNMLRQANSLRILCIDGWEHSEGVRQEIEYAEERNREGVLSYLPLVMTNVAGALQDYVRPKLWELD